MSGVHNIVPQEGNIFCFKAEESLDQLCCPLEQFHLPKAKKQNKQKKHEGKG